MANLTESPIYEPGIFQLEKTTPPLGGAPAFNGTNPSAGHANVQAAQLANRTSWLKQQIEDGGSALSLKGLLESTTDEEHGASLVGYDDVLTYTEGTVGESLNLLSKKRHKSLSDVLKKARSGGQITIECRGDSITYGQDTSARGVDTQINGASQKRSTAPYPEKLAESLSLLDFAVPPIVVNHGFPGDNSTQGLIRWAGASPVDLVIIMYGHNDANSYGGLGVVDIPTFRANIARMIEIEFSKGAAVILMGPPPVRSSSDMNIRPYANELKSLAANYGIPFIDAAQQVSTLTNIWTDGVHLTSLAYREMGWHIAALFARTDASMREVGVGTFVAAAQGMGSGGSVFTWTVGSESRQLLQLSPGQTLAIGVNCLNRCQPIVHSVNGTGTTSVLSAYNSAGALGTVKLNHVPSEGIEQMLYATPIEAGYRIIQIRNEGTGLAYIKGVEFTSFSAPAMSRKNSKRVLSLSGAHIPMRNSSMVGPLGWVALANYENRINILGGMIFKVRLPSTTGSPGVAVITSRNSNFFPSNNSILAIRSGVNLIFRKYANAESITDITVSNFFTSGVEWIGELEIELSDGTSRLYADGVLVATMTGSTVSAGWGALVCTGGVATPSCESAFIYGYDCSPI